MRDKVQYIIIGTLSVAFWKTACNYFGGKFAFMVLLPYFCNEESKRSKRKLSSQAVNCLCRTYQKHCLRQSSAFFLLFLV